MDGKPGSLVDQTRHAFDQAAGGTPIGDWARAEKPTFTFTDPEEAIGRLFNIMSAVRFQMIQIAGEVDNLRAAVARLESKT